jgi:hypothetical protein
VKSHFAGRENSGTKRKFRGEDFGQIHIMKFHFADEERLRKRREASKKILLM